MASSSYVIQQLIPTLAAQLARLRRTPGRDYSWVSPALKALEQGDPARFERVRRRIGFARRLGELAALEAKDMAALTLGLFFHQLAEDPAGRGKSSASSAWLQYLLRNEDWLWPAYRLCEEMAVDGWQASESKVTVVANVTVTFDRETGERHERPLQVIQQLLTEGQSEVADQVIPLLWTEQGQELCDYHFRRPPGSYRLAASDLERCFEVMSADAVRYHADEAVAAFHLSGARHKTTVDEEEETMPMPSQQSQPPREPGAAPAGINFNRRREELRARSAFGLQDFAAPAQADENGRRQKPQESAPDALDVDAAGTTERPTAAGRRPGSSEPEPRADAVPTKYQEDAMEAKTFESIRSVTPVPPARSDALDMMQKLQDVRLQLGQIERMAQDAEQLLTGLAPQLDELAAWIGEMDSILGRWRGRDRMERAA